MGSAIASMIERVLNSIIQSGKASRSRNDVEAEWFVILIVFHKN